MIVGARETGPGLRGGRPAAIDPAKADQRKVAHRLVVLGVVAVHDGPEELRRLAQSVDVVEMQSIGWPMQSKSTPIRSNAAELMLVMIARWSVVITP